MCLPDPWLRGLDGQRRPFEGRTNSGQRRHLHRFPVDARRHRGSVDYAPYGSGLSGMGELLDPELEIPPKSDPLAAGPAVFMEVCDKTTLAVYKIGRT